MFGKCFLQLLDHGDDLNRQNITEVNSTSCPTHARTTTAQESMNEEFGTLNNSNKRKNQSKQSESEKTCRNEFDARIFINDKIENNCHQPN